MSIKTKRWWKNMLAVVTAGSLSAGSASADITFEFTDETWTGVSFQDFLSEGQEAQGTLTAVSVNATLNASVALTYANDLCIYVDDEPLSTGGLLQVGGWSDLEASERLSWPNGDSSAPGTVVSGTVTLTTPLTFAGTAADPTIWLGNGYGAQGTSGTWTGSVTLVGLTAVPEPTSTGLLLAGMAVAAGGYYRRRAVTRT